MTPQRMILLWAIVAALCLGTLFVSINRKLDTIDRKLDDLIVVRGEAQ